MEQLDIEPEDNLLLVNKMKDICCTAMVNGKKRIKAAFYFCTCDPDQKDPICEECAEKCHKNFAGHYLSQKVIAKEICRCGFHNHTNKLMNKDDNNQKYVNTCLFFELTNKAEMKILFSNEENDLCLFCYNNCLNSDDKILYSTANIEENFTIDKCDCKHSNHLDIKSTYNMISKINIREGEYSFLNYCLLFNSIFKSEMFFNNLYSSFRTNVNAILQNLDAPFEIDSSFIFSNFFRSLMTLNNLTSKHKFMHYYCESSKQYFSFNILKKILSIKLKFFDENILKFKNTLLQTYFTVVVKGAMRTFPYIKADDLLQMTPVQRSYISNIIKENKAYTDLMNNPNHQNLVEFNINLFFSNTKYIYNESSYFEFLKTITSCLRNLAKVELFNEQQKFKYLNLIEKLLNKIFEQNKSESKGQSKNDERTNQMMLKLFSNIMTTMLIFSIQMNDNIFNNNYAEFLQKRSFDSNFFHSANQLGKLITRNLVVLMCSIQAEIPKKIDDKIYKIVNHSNDMLNMLISTQDFYFIGLKNSFCVNLKVNLRCLKETIPIELKFFEQLLINRIETIEKGIVDYFDFKVDCNFITFLACEMVKDIFEALKMDFISTIIKGESNVEQSESMSQSEVGDKILNLENSLKTISVLILENELYSVFTNIKSATDPWFKNIIVKTNAFFYLMKLISVISEFLVEEILISVERIFKFLYYMIVENPSNAFLMLTSSSFELLFSLPSYFSTIVFRFIYTCINVVHFANIEIHHSTKIMQLLMKYLEQNINEVSIYKNLNIFLKIITLLLEKTDDFDASFFIYETRKLMKIIWRSYNIFIDFKYALLDDERDYSISGVSSINAAPNEIGFISEKVFNENRTDEYECSLKLAYKIVSYYLHLINIVFDDDAIYNDNNFLIRILEKKEVQKILLVSNLPLSLRNEILKFYRMVYIDVSINFEHIHLYRAEFCRSIDIDSSEEGIGKVYPFLERLVKISDIEIFGNLENEILMSEFKNFENNVQNEKNTKHFFCFLNEALIPTMKIYVFKMFCSVTNMSGNDFLKEYELIVSFLKFKIRALEIVKEDTPSKHVNNMLLKTQLLIDELLNDSFVCLDFKEVYRLTKNSFEEITVEKAIKLTINQTVSEIKTIKETRFFRLFQGDVNNKEEQFISIIFTEYRKQKFQLENSSFVKYLSDLNTTFQVSYRQLFIKYVFFMMTVPEFSEINTNLNNYILTLLKFDTQNTQSDTARLYKEKKNGIDLVYCANLFFLKFLAFTFQSFNPSSIKKNDNNYEQTCNLIQIFKFLCEEQNNFFQDTLMNTVKLETSNALFNKKTIGFYEFLIYIILKIILVNEWDITKSVDTNSSSLKIFEYIIDFLTEVIQGSKKENFKTLIAKENKQVEEKQKMMLSTMSVRLEKALFQKLDYNSNCLMILLNTIKIIIFNNRNNDDTFYAIKIKLCQFCLGFLEEFNTPPELKETVIGFLNTTNCLLSIKSILKDIFYKHFIKFSRNEQTRVMSNLLFIKKNEKEGNANVTSNNLVNNQAELTIKEVEKMLKGITINEYLYNFFKDLYDNNEEFFESCEFSFAKNLFMFINIAAYDFKKEEAIKLLQRVEIVQNKGLMSVYYELNGDHYRQKVFINNLVYEEASSYDIEFFEEYFILKLFLDFTRSVTIRLENGSEQQTIYTIHPSINYLSKNTKEDFIKNVDRTNIFTKLNSMVEYCEYFKEEIEYNYKSSKNNSLYKFSNQISYYFLSVVFYFFVVGFNLYFIWTLNIHDVDSEASPLISEVLEPHKYFILTFSVIQLILNLVVIWFWVKTKLMLYYRIETSKFVNENKVQKESLTKYQKFKIFFIRSILWKNEIILFFSNIIITSIVLIFPSLSFLFCLQLIQAIQLNKTIRNVILAITIKKKELLTAWLLIAVLSYIYSTLAFYFYRDDYIDNDVP